MDNPVRSFVGVLYNAGVSQEDCLSFLDDYYSSPLETSEFESFNHSSYYEEEMGAELIRFWFHPSETWEEQRLAEQKRRAIRIEKEASKQFDPSARPINLDPGYIKRNRLVLASTKDADHRIAVAEDIFAELTLLYEDGCFQPLPWTYPDYRSEIAQIFFRNQRDQYFSSVRPE